MEPVGDSAFVHHNGAGSCDAAQAVRWAPPVSHERTP